jgi:hypothetical protein
MTYHSEKIEFLLGGMKRDSILSCSQGPAKFSSLGPIGEITLGEPPTPTIGHVRPVMGLTKCPSYLFSALFIIHLEIRGRV